MVYQGAIGQKPRFHFSSRKFSRGFSPEKKSRISSFIVQVLTGFLGPPNGAVTRYGRLASGYKRSLPAT